MGWTQTLLPCFLVSTGIINLVIFHFVWFWKNHEQLAVIEASETSKQFATANQNTMEITNVPATKVQQAEKLPENIQKWMGQSGSICSMCSKRSGCGCILLTWREERPICIHYTKCKHLMHLKAYLHNIGELDSYVGSVSTLKIFHVTMRIVVCTPTFTFPSGHWCQSWLFLYAHTPPSQFHRVTNEKKIRFIRIVT